MDLPYFDADEIRGVLTFERAIDAIDRALRSGVDPEDDAPRLFSPAPNGEFLIMPATGAAYSGVKALTVAPGNPERGLEKIQGVYVLVSSDTLAPVAVMDGSVLTAIRTPATTLCAVRAIAAAAPRPMPAAPRVLVYGAGTQAHGMIAAAAGVFGPAVFGVVGRTPERVDALRRGFEGTIEVSDRTGDRAGAVAEADVIICATTSDAPLFDGALVKDDAIVAAVGTHGLDRRELDDGLVRRADLVVEGRRSARAENGNLATALTAEDWRDRPPANLRDAVRGAFTRRPGRPAVYTGVGMSWEDLVCASVVFDERGGRADAS
ncbi:ornithine cyclodeaminase family protein [Agromyces aerolatus]|uniref:ornithine cyclodeaminase family protein n=1 Tax=Agromyces sp. LY-1074 TaxID=3074080 RepID=UPI0028617104|nr:MULTISPECIES: ornithine cyclodeaminase family protein [unclassified Agromyces]MDR5701562.1 ornithine cyclodeaminase family protein [Agromyces sp. LY-1074]MDR5707831.1 ornithine cyclodeaminase family protein [Agromyces sp. LY-1358]